MYVTDDVASASREEQQAARDRWHLHGVQDRCGSCAENGSNLDEVERVMRAANAATYSLASPSTVARCLVRTSRCLPSMRGTWTSGLASTASRESPQLLDAGQGSGCEARRDGPRRASGRSERPGCCTRQRAWRHQARNCSCCTATSTNSSKQQASCRCPRGGRTGHQSRYGRLLALGHLAGRGARRLLGRAGGFRRGAPVASERFTTRRAGRATSRRPCGKASEDSIAAAAMARTAVDAIAVVEENKKYLGRIDAIAGDGDHGIGMSRGSSRRRGCQRDPRWGRDGAERCGSRLW